VSGITVLRRSDDLLFLDPGLATRFLEPPHKIARETRAGSAPAICLARILLRQLRAGTEQGGLIGKNAGDYDA
jgi:hypothetical protein